MWMFGRNGSSPTARPPSTRTTGYGTRSGPASQTRPTTPASRAMKSSTLCTDLRLPAWTDAGAPGVSGRGRRPDAEGAHGRTDVGDGAFGSAVDIRPTARRAARPTEGDGRQRAERRDRPGEVGGGLGVGHEDGREPLERRPDRGRGREGRE